LKLGNTKHWQLFSGSIIVIVAFVLMVPGFITYTFSLWRIGLFVIFTISIAFAITYALTKITNKKPGKALRSLDDDTSIKLNKSSTKDGAN
jgi:UPF0716 family protein affecting phage T7 exclusion